MYYVYFEKGDQMIRVAEFAEVNEAVIYVQSMQRKAKAFGALLSVKFEEE